jgi:hypothetical protein
MPGATDEEPPAAILASNVPETTTAQDPLAVATGDGTAIVETGADTDVDCDGMSSRRYGCRHCEAESQGNVREKKVTRDNLRGAWSPIG